MGADLSEWKYLVVELQKEQSRWASFRLFDVNNYWDKPAAYDFGSSTRIVIDLHNMKDENGKSIDPSHIYIAGFWTLGGSPIYIKNVFLSNDGEQPAGLSQPWSNEKAQPVYNLQGVRIGMSDKMDCLSPGIYIINGKKIVKWNKTKRM